MARQLYIKSYGCQMNVYDSARMADVLAPLGYHRVDAPDDADLIVLNTCHIREKAAEKLYSDLGRLRAAGDNALIAVAGCVAQAEGVEILRRAPHVDMVFGPQTYHRLPEMVARAVRARAGGGRAGRGAGIVETDFPADPKFDTLPAAAAQGPSAFLTVQEGCDKFCSFCVVPYTRGAEYSRPAAAVVAEARALVASGAREITLLGQNVNAYHGDAPAGRTEWGLGRLVHALAEIDGLARIRYTTSHPRDMDAELIAAHGRVPQLMPYLHLPVQSGSDRVLARMNRRHRISDYLPTVEALRRARSDMAFSSDFIVGHPGETEEDFLATLGLVREVRFAQAYSFKYSPRPGTPAADAPDQVTEETKDRRLARLQALLGACQRDFNQSFTGRSLSVLFDRPGRVPGQAAGRSPYMQAVHVACRSEDDARRLDGQIREVTVTEVHANSLAAVLAGGDAVPPEPTADPEPALA